MMFLIVMIKILLTVLFLYWAIGIHYFAKKRPEYSHIKHSISELGESGSSYEIQVGYGIFFPVGLFFFVSAFLLKNMSADAALLSTFMGCGYFFSAFFPCDPKTPLLGTWKNSVHNIVGAVCYVGCIATLLDINSQQNDLFSSIVFYALVVFLVIFMLGWPKVTGLFQRIVECGIFVVIFLQL